MSSSDSTSLYCLQHPPLNSGQAAAPRPPHVSASWTGRLRLALSCQGARSVRRTVTVSDTSRCH